MTTCRHMHIQGVVCHRWRSRQPALFEGSSQKQTKTDPETMTDGEQTTHGRYAVDGYVVFHARASLSPLAPASSVVRSCSPCSSFPSSRSLSCRTPRICCSVVTMIRCVLITRSIWPARTSGCAETRPGIEISVDGDQRVVLAWRWFPPRAGVERHAPVVPLCASLSSYRFSGP